MAIRKTTEVRHREWRIAMSSLILRVMQEVHEMSPSGLDLEDIDLSVIAEMNDGDEP